MSVKALCLVALVLALAPARSWAAVAGVQVTDVTPRSFAVVWASDQAVTAAQVRVFADASGAVELTATLTQRVVSASVPDALALGLLKVEVNGLAPGARVFVQTATSSASGTVRFPAAAPFLPVNTATRTTKTGTGNALIVNDLVRHDMAAPGGGPATSGLVLFEFPRLGKAPLSAFVGQSGVPGAAVVDLNDLYDATSGQSAEVPEDAIFIVTEYRGRLCPSAQFAAQRQVRFRRVPAHTRVGNPAVAVTRLQNPGLCFGLDLVCDDIVDIQDAQRIVNAFGSTRAAGCGFNPDFDVVNDGAVDIQDVQRVFNRFGDFAPFEP